MIKVAIENIQKEKIEPFFDKWSELQETIHEMHSERNKEVHKLMEEAITVYEQLILFTSGHSLDSKLSQDDYEVLPLNGMERLQFIKMRPGQFASFRQLDELFKETKKKIARLRVQK